MTIAQEVKLQEILATAHHDFEKGLNARAFFKVNNRAVGQDLVQDTFLKTWNYLVKGGEIKAMKAFLYHVLNNLIIDQYRKHKTTSLDILLEKGFEPCTLDHDISNPERFLNVLDGSRAVNLIERLPETYKKVMWMKHVEDLSPKEMSNLSGVSETTLAVQLHRGLEKLKLLYID